MNRSNVVSSRCVSSFSFINSLRNLRRGSLTLSALFSITAGVVLSLGVVNLVRYVVAQNAVEQAARRAARCLTPTDASSECVFTEAPSLPQQDWYGIDEVYGDDQTESVDMYRYSARVATETWTSDYLGYYFDTLGSYSGSVYSVPSYARALTPYTNDTYTISRKLKIKAEKARKYYVPKEQNQGVLSAGVFNQDGSSPVTVSGYDAWVRAMAAKGLTFSSAPISNVSGASSVQKYTPGMNEKQHYGFTAKVAKNSIVRFSTDYIYVPELAECDLSHGKTLLMCPQCGKEDSSSCVLLPGFEKLYDNLDQGTASSYDSTDFRKYAFVSFKIFGHFDHSKPGNSITWGPYNNTSLPGFFIEIEEPDGRGNYVTPPQYASQNGDPGYCMGGGDPSGNADYDSYLRGPLGANGGTNEDAAVCFDGGNARVVHQALRVKRGGRFRIHGVFELNGGVNAATNADVSVAYYLDDYILKTETGSGSVTIVGDALYPILRADKARCDVSDEVIKAQYKKNAKKSEKNYFIRSCETEVEGGKYRPIVDSAKNNADKKHYFPIERLSGQRQTREQVCTEPSGVTPRFPVQKAWAENNERYAWDSWTVSEVSKGQKILPEKPACCSGISCPESKVSGMCPATAKSFRDCPDLVKIVGSGAVMPADYSFTPGQLGASWHWSKNGIETNQIAREEIQRGGNIFRYKPKDDEMLNCNDFVKAGILVSPSDASDKAPLDYVGCRNVAVERGSEDLEIAAFGTTFVPELAKVAVNPKGCERINYGNPIEAKAEIEKYVLAQRADLAGSDIVVSYEKIGKELVSQIDGCTGVVSVRRNGISGCVTERSSFGRLCRVNSSFLGQYVQGMRPQACDDSKYDFCQTNPVQDNEKNRIADGISVNLAPVQNVAMKEMQRAFGQRVALGCDGAGCAQINATVDNPMAQIDVTYNLPLVFPFDVLIGEHLPVSTHKEEVMEIYGMAQ